MVQVGDSIPSIELVEGAPDKKINLAEELATGSGIIIGVPAAFSKSHLFTQPLHLQMTVLQHLMHSGRILMVIPVGPTCSDSHIPGFIAHPKIGSAGKVFVISVNDAFV
jgi:2-Cys peroxiredoxin 5